MGDDASQRSLDKELSQLRAIVDKLMDRLGEPPDRQARINAIVASADQQPSFSQPKPKRDRHGMHIVRGCGAVAAGWLLRSRVRQAVAVAAMAATATGATLSPDLMQRAPAAQVPHSAAPVAHHHHGTVPVLPAVPATRKRRRNSNDPTVRPSTTVPPPPAAPSPGVTTPPRPPAPTGTPVPLPPAPSPVPPAPSPVPTCLDMDGHHCDGHGPDARDAAGALRGLQWQP